MAINRLTDIVTAMKSKWTYGDKSFAYTFEVNEQHNTTYPYMMINPPNSEMPEVYGGWEAYNFEIDFFDLYQRANQDAVALDQKWDNLQDLALEWIDNVMINFNNPQGSNVGIYFLEETLDFQRVKEVANDRLVQIKMSFTLRAVTRCLKGNIPKSYPNQISNLAVWLKADSGLTYSKPTKKISAWADQSGNNNNVSQATSDNQPLRYNYDGASDKTRVNFDGTADKLVSDANSPITTDFTIFTVAQAESVTPAFTNTYSSHMSLGNDACNLGNPSGGSGGQYFSFTDGANDEAFAISVWSNNDPTNPWRGWVEKHVPVVGITPSESEYSFKPEYATGYIYAYIYDNVAGGSIYARVTESAVVRRGEWQHFVMTYDGSGTSAGIHIYVDGVKKDDHHGSTGAFDRMRLTSSDLKIGKGNNNSYYGFIDEVSMFKTELSQANVTELYNLGNPGDISTSSIAAHNIGWWRMGDGATFPTIPDASGNGHNGTLENMVSSDIREFVPTSEKASYFTYTSGSVMLNFGSSSSRLYCQVADNAAATGEWNARYVWNGDTSKYHIGMMALESSSSTLELKYNNETAQTGTMSNYNTGQTYNAATFTVGHGSRLGYLGGNIQEIIIYNRNLLDEEKENVRNYLNNKYKIY
jgi:hypothetical protein